MQTFKHSRKLNSKNVTGQGMSEYMIIVGLIAVGALTAFGVLGTIVENNGNAIATELAGTDATGHLTANSGSATTNAASNNAVHTLGNYTNQ